MDKQTLEILEYYRIRSLIAGNASNAEGRAFIESKEPSVNKDQIDAEKKLTADWMKSLISPIASAGIRIRSIVCRKAHAIPFGSPKQKNVPPGRNAKCFCAKKQDKLRQRFPGRLILPGGFVFSSSQYYAALHSLGNIRINPFGEQNETKRRE